MQADSCTEETSAREMVMMQLQSVKCSMIGTTCVLHLLTYLLAYLLTSPYAFVRPAARDLITEVVASTNTMSDSGKGKCMAERRLVLEK